MGKDFSDYKNSIVVLLKDLSSYFKFKYGFDLKKDTSFNRAIVDKKTAPRMDEKTQKRISVKYGAYIDYFESTLRYNLPQKLLNNFYKNIQTAKICGLCFQMGDFINTGKFAGRYNMKENSIAIDISYDSEMFSIFHELLHLSSAKRSDYEDNQLGFSFYKNGIYKMGSRLNEGYTDLLTTRYFGHVGCRPVYEIEHIFSSLTEQIVGKDKMEECYFNADLRGLVKELEKYDYMENIVYFIKELDVFNIKEDPIIKYQRLNNMMYFLIRSFIVKQIKEKGDINNPYVINEIHNFMSQIPTVVRVGNRDTRLDLTSIYSNVMRDINVEMAPSRKGF